MKPFQQMTEHATVWLKAMMAELPTNDPGEALQGLRASLCAIRDVLTIEDVANLSAQLPVLIRGMMFDGWQPQATPVTIADCDELVSIAREKLAPRERPQAERMVAASIRVLVRRVSPGETLKLLARLPSGAASWRGSPYP